MVIEGDLGDILPTPPLIEPFFFYFLFSLCTSYINVTIKGTRGRFCPIPLIPPKGNRKYATVLLHKWNPIIDVIITWSIHPIILPMQNKWHSKLWLKKKIGEIVFNINTAVLCVSKFKTLVLLTKISGGPGPPLQRFGQVLPVRLKRYPGFIISWDQV